MAVGVHSEQIVQIVKKMEMNAQLTGNLQGVSCSAAFDNAVRLFVYFLGANYHGTFTPFMLKTVKVNPSGNRDADRYSSASVPVFLYFFGVYFSTFRALDSQYISLSLIHI